MAVAAYVTTQAQLKLNEYLSKLWQSVVYCDTDSVIYVQKVDKPPNVTTGHYVGDLTDDLEDFSSGFFTEQFVSGGSKTTRFR